MNATLEQVHSQLEKASRLLESVNSIKTKLEGDFSENLKNAENEIGIVEASLNEYVNIESVPGARTPKWYTVDIDFDSGETQSKSRAFEISSEGAFVISTMQVFYKVTDTNASNYAFTSDATNLSPVTLPIGRYLPATAYPIFAEGVFKNIVRDAATTPTPSVSGNSLYEFPEFSFLFEVETASQRWTNRPIPASALYTTEHPLHFGETCYLERTERLIVTARPDARIPLTGTLRLVMHGYQVLGPMDPTKFRRFR